MNCQKRQWRTLPILQAIHDQWWTARGARFGASQRPFSRDWEQLLEDAGLVSAEQRREAERDAGQLSDAGLLELRPVKYRPHLIDRVLIPLSAEPRLAKLFNDPIKQVDQDSDLSGIDWEPELRFVPGIRLGVAKDDLLQLNAFLASGGPARPVIPIKERSLEIFGDEKRLDALLPSALFREGRLSLEALRCEIVGEPLGWKRGPNPQAPVLVIENAATWHSYCRWNDDVGQFSAVVYGKGFVVTDSVRYLAEILDEIGGQRRVYYFGDLDPPGLAIPFRASLTAKRAGLPPIEPHVWSYHRLFEVGRGKESDWEGNDVAEVALSWLGELEEKARALFASGKRLAQEHIGWEFLRNQTVQSNEDPHV